MTVRRIVLPLLVIAGALLVASGFDGVRRIAYADGSAAVIDAGAAGGSGSAATATPTVPDPLGHPGDTLSTLSKLYHSGAWVPLSIVLAFVLLIVLTKETSWLRQGKRAAYVAAGLGALTVLVGPATQGTSPSLAMVISALGAAIALIVNPAKASS